MYIYKLTDTQYTCMCTMYIHRRIHNNDTCIAQVFVAEKQAHIIYIHKYIHTDTQYTCIIQVHTYIYTHNIHACTHCAYIDTFITTIPA